MKRLLLGSLASAVALMIWGALFWTVLPFTDLVLHALPNEATTIVWKLKEHVPENGFYLFPFLDKAENAADPEGAKVRWNRRHTEGPLVEIIYRKEGVSTMAGIGTLLLGFLHFFVIAAGAGLILQRASPVLATYRSRVLFVFSLGVFAAVMIELANPIWFHHPWDYYLLMMVFDGVNAAIIGAILGYFVKSEVVAVV